MEEIATITFTECETSSDATAIIRRDAESVALCLTVESNGDLEVVMKRDDAKRLLDALHAALA